jgi:hypothetical protein
MGLTGQGKYREGRYGVKRVVLTELTTYSFHSPSAFCNIIRLAIAPDAKGQSEPVPSKECHSQQQQQQ